MEPKRGRACAKRKGSKIFQLRIENNSWKLKTWKKPGATIAGTQAVDRWWQSLDRFIPSSLNNKDWSKGGLNQKLILYMHAFVWRYHLPVTADLKSHLGKLKWVKTKRAATAEFTPITQTPVFYRTKCCRRHKWDQVKYPRVTLFFFLCNILKHSIAWMIMF